MNQQEIFKNYTKGELVLGSPARKVEGGSVYTSPVLYENSVGRIAFKAFGKTETEAHCNAIAFRDAVNATYGAGINPEAVGMMRDVLTKLAMQNGIENNPLSSEISAALTAAKLDSHE